MPMHERPWLPEDKDCRTLTTPASPRSTSCMLWQSLPHSLSSDQVALLVGCSLSARTPHEVVQSSKKHCSLTTSPDPPTLLCTSSSLGPIVPSSHRSLGA